MFELSAGTLERPHRWGALAMSLGSHTGLILFAALLSWVATAPRVPQRDTSMAVTHAFYLPPPTGMRAAGGKTAALRPATIPSPAVEVPDEGVEQPLAKTMPAGFDAAGASSSLSGYRATGSAVVGGLNSLGGEGKGFRAEGETGSVGIFQAAGPAEGVKAAAPLPADEPAELLSAPEPVYSEEAKRRGVTGTVVVEVMLAASGHVQFLRILSPLGYGLNEAAVEAAKRVRFRPALRAGVPIDVVGRISVIFSLT